MRIALIGNCHVERLAACLRLMLPDCFVSPLHLGVSPISHADAWDVVLIQTEYRYLFDPGQTLHGIAHGRLLSWPTFYFPGYHPDLVYVKSGEAAVPSPIGDYHSSIILHSFKRRLSEAAVERLFCEDTYEKLNFFDYWNAAVTAMEADLQRSDIKIEDALYKWTARGCFAHSVNHPKLFVIASIAEAIVDTLGLTAVKRQPEDYLHDTLADLCTWPVYPEIARRLNIRGDYAFKVSRNLCPGDNPIQFLDLPAFIAASYKIYADAPASSLSCDRLSSQADLYKTLSRPAAVRSAAAGKHGKDANPYRDLPDHCFWRRAVVAPHWTQVDPVVKPKFAVQESDRIATAGSCFAQHLTRSLIQAKRNLLQTEVAPAHLTAQDAAENGYGLFSARYGNVYSGAQFLQLVQRAFGAFTPADTAWQRADGRYIDPFRPTVQPDGYGRAKDVAAAREPHLDAVRRLFENADVLIFTIGLTEAWRAKADGAVFPVAPGVVADVQPGPYEAVSFTAAEVRADLDAAFALLRTRNPGLRIILTVSPVPLMATHIDRHVLVSNAHSKSVLRAVCGELAAAEEAVDYFPSYEIITGNHARGRYFADDLREVRPEGVAHVMRLFNTHYFGDAAPVPVGLPGGTSGADPRIAREIAKGAKIICDENLLDRIWSRRPRVWRRGG